MKFTLFLRYFTLFCSPPPAPIFEGSDAPEVPATDSSNEYDAPEESDWASESGEESDSGADSTSSGANVGITGQSASSSVINAVNEHQEETREEKIARLPHYLAQPFKTIDMDDCNLELAGLQCKYTLSDGAIADFARWHNRHAEERKANTQSQKRRRRFQKVTLPFGGGKYLKHGQIRVPPELGLSQTHINVSITQLVFRYHAVIITLSCW